MLPSKKVNFKPCNVFEAIYLLGKIGFVVHARSCIDGKNHNEQKYATVDRCSR